MWSLFSVFLLWRMDRKYKCKGTFEIGNACFCKWEERCFFFVELFYDLYYLGNVG